MLFAPCLFGNHKSFRADLATLLATVYSRTPRPSRDDLGLNAHRDRYPAYRSHRPAGISLGQAPGGALPRDSQGRVSILVGERAARGMSSGQGGSADQFVDPLVLRPSKSVLVPTCRCRQHAARTAKARPHRPGSGDADQRLNICTAPRCGLRAPCPPGRHRSLDISPGPHLASLTAPAT